MATFADIPSVADIRSALITLSHAEMTRLSAMSGVPFTTLWKIRDGTTRNPGIETIGKFVGQIDQLRTTDSDARPALVKEAAN